MRPHHLKLMPTVGCLWLLAFSVADVFASRWQLDQYETALLPNSDASNEVKSPMGVWSALGALALGARENTLQQIATVFNFPRTDRPSLLTYLQQTTEKLRPDPTGLDLLSHVYVLTNEGFPLKTPYTQDLQNVLGGTLLSLDFKNSAEAARLANEEVRKRLGGDFRPFTPDDFRGDLLATSLITLKGKWRSPFAPYATSERPFHDEDGRRLGHVNMMLQKKALPLVDDALLQAQVLELAYGSDGRYSMLVLLPDANATGSVKKVLAKLPALDIDDLLRRLRDSVGAVQEGSTPTVLVSLPRFATKSSLRAEGALRRAGVADLFSDSADLGLLSDVPLHAFRVSQQARLEVTEAGSEARDAGGREAPAEETAQRRFTADHPFVYLIVSKEIKKVLFYGVYARPELY